MAIGASLFLGSAVFAIAEEVSLTPAQMRSVAHLSLKTGNPGQALQLADALLLRDPEEVNALILKSRALRDMGQYDDALKAARAAYGKAESDEEVFAAAMVRAQALASKGARTRAQIWLRMAGQYAPDDASRDVAIRDFRYVRDRNPWSTKLSFSVTPTSNVNNGAVHDTISGGGGQGLDRILFADEQALSGLQYSGGLTTRYRFSEGERHQTEVGLHLYGQTYTLSDDAKKKLKEDAANAASEKVRDRLLDTKGSDFAYASVAVGLVHRFRADAWNTPLELNLLTGTSWYGQEPYSRYSRAGVAKRFALGKDTMLRLDAGFEGFRQIAGDKTLVSQYSGFEGYKRAGEDSTSQSLSANAVLFQELNSGAGLRFSFGLLGTESDAGALKRNRVKGGVGYTLSNPIGGATVTLQAEAQKTKYPDYPQFRGAYGFWNGGIVPILDSVEREDVYGSVGVRLWFEDVDFYGFSPTLSIDYSETHSNLDQFDTVETGIKFGFRSSF